MPCRSRIAAIALIVMGALFLASNLGYIPHLGLLLRQWWPVILIVVGVALLAKK